MARKREREKTTLDFDELNELSEIKQLEKQVRKAKQKKSGFSIVVPIPYRQYFGEMYITPEQMDSRIELAKEIEDVMLWVFAYWLIAADAGISKEELKQDAKDKLTSVIAKRTTLDPYLEKHIDQVIEEVVDVTEKRKKEEQEQEQEQEQSDEDDDVDKVLEDEDEDKEKSDNLERSRTEFGLSEDSKGDYWTSQERAMLISENEANAFNNYIEYRKAKAEGKTLKTWITELDDKVRLTHTIAEGQTVDIDGLFLIGDSLMRFPKDVEYDPEPSEVINCRCSCIYE